MSDFWAGRRVLVTGGAGFLGKAVRRRLAERGAPEPVVPRRTQFDLRVPSEADRLFEQAEPDLVVHLAARVGGMARPAERYLDNPLMGT